MAETLENAGGTGETGSIPAAPPPPGARKPRGRRLGSVQNVKALLGDVLRRVESGELGAVPARGLIYGCSVLLSAIQGAASSSGSGRRGKGFTVRDHEKRVEALENPNAGRPSTEAYLLAQMRGGRPEEAEAFLQGKGQNLEQLVLGSMKGTGWKRDP